MPADAGAVPQGTLFHLEHFSPAFGATCPIADQVVKRANAFETVRNRVLRFVTPDEVVDAALD